jgi:hypothetical protein
MPDLSDGVNWSEIDANNNQAPPNGWPEGMMPSGVNDAARADRGALKRFWDKINPVQGITPSGGVWTFTTANPAYPTAYVNGEIYCFHPAVLSAGNDQFQVNALGPKPILKRIAQGSGTTLIPVIAGDFRGHEVRLVYDAALNAGAGAFFLSDPFIPISGDGTGTGVSMPGALAVTGPLSVTSGGISLSGDIRFGTPTHPDKTISYITCNGQPAGNRRIGITASDPGGVTYYPLEQLWINAAVTAMTGSLSATGYGSRSGINGPSQANNFNIQWDGAQAHLWIDSTDQGPIVTGAAGNVVIGGNISAGSISASGNVTAGGNISAGNQLSGNTIVASTDLSSNGRLDIAGAGTINGQLQVGSLTTTGTVTAAAASISGAASIGGNTTIGGTLQVNNNRIYVQGSNAPSVSCGNTGDGNTWGMWSASSAMTLGQCDNTGAPFSSILHLIPGTLWPNTDNGSIFGKSGLAWAQVWSYSYPAPSDPTLKTDIKPVPAGCLDLVRAIEPKTYRWASPAPDDDPERVNWGFLAPEIATAMAASGVKFGGLFAPRPDDDQGKWGLAYDQLIPVLWAAVRELADKLKSKEEDR